jgi:hypothetical protein
MYDDGLNFGYDQIYITPSIMYDVEAPRFNDVLDIKTTENALREKMYLLEKAQRTALPMYVNPDADLHRIPKPGHGMNSPERIYYDMARSDITRNIENHYSGNEELRNYGNVYTPRDVVLMHRDDCLCGDCKSKAEIHERASLKNMLESLKMRNDILSWVLVFLIVFLLVRYSGGVSVVNDMVPSHYIATSHPASSSAPVAPVAPVVPVAPVAPVVPVAPSVL